MNRQPVWLRLVVLASRPRARRMNSRGTAAGSAQLSWLTMWRVTDLAWPRPADSYDACMRNVKDLLRHGVHVASGVDAFDIPASFKKLCIQDPSSVGLVLWSGPHPRSHDKMNRTVHGEIQKLRWWRHDFVRGALDMLSSSLPQATVIACDKGDWANGVLLPLDHKPLVTFKTHYGEGPTGERFRSEASGFEGRHVRFGSTDQFVGLGLVGPFLQHDCVIGQKVVDIPQLAMHVAQAGLYVIFVGEFTCAQSQHCLMRAVRDCVQVPKRMLCHHPWHEIPAPRRGWKRGADETYSLQEFRDEARAKFIRWSPDLPVRLSALHAASVWARAVPRGRAGVSDFGDVMWPSTRPNI